jgi:hypothetical protein
MVGILGRRCAARRRQIACSAASLLAALVAFCQMPGTAAADRDPAGAGAGAASRLNPNGLYLARGLDPTRGRLFVEDFAGQEASGPTVRHKLRESTDWGATFTDDKGLPPGVDSIAKVISFKRKIYVVGKDTTSGLVGVYSAADTEGSQQLQWSGPLLTLNRSATILGSDFNTDGRFLYVGEYGDPKPGPRVYRSRNGRTWRTVFGPAKGIRHIHGIAADPYRPGQVWMTTGDGVTAAYRSRRSGAARSWRVAIKSSAWQSVQISFDRSHVYLAADTHSATFFVVNPATGKPRVGTPDYFASQSPPGSPSGTRYLFNAFFGAVDPATGVYYCVANDNSEGGQATGGGELWQGFFAVRRVGGPLSVLDPGGLAISMNGEVFVGGGRVFSGQWSLPALG